MRNNMRHLEKFNESKWGKSKPRFSTLSKWLEELQDFCDTNLAYLLDQNLIVKISPNSQYVMVSLKMDRCAHVDFFNWVSFKDSIIPWLIRLNRTYDVSNKVSYYRLIGDKTRLGVVSLTTNLKDILDDNFEPTKMLYELEIIIYL